MPHDPAAKLIRYGLSEPMSHFATGYHTNNHNGLVLHQRMVAGFQIDWLPYFMDKNEIIYALEPKRTTLIDEQNIMKALMQEFSGTDYDEGSLAYFAWRAFLLKFFGEPLPKRGEWGDTKDPLCTGHARVLKRLKPLWFSKEIDDFDIVTPGSLYNNMLNSNNFIDRTAEWQK